MARAVQGTFPPVTMGTFVPTAAVICLFELPVTLLARADEVIELSKAM